MRVRAGRSHQLGTLFVGTSGTLALALLAPAGETFFLNQFKELHEINLSEKADFLVNKKYTFEIGGKNKTRKQILDIPNSYVAKDMIEIGYGNLIPVWLFGFMY